MNYWLVKSEPFKYSWAQFVKDGRTFWDGVRNYGARNNLKAMKKGDHVFFYHSNEGLAIVGNAKVVKEAYQDPTTSDVNWVAVDLKPLRAMRRPIFNLINLIFQGPSKRLRNVCLHGIRRNR